MELPEILETQLTDFLKSGQPMREEMRDLVVKLVTWQVEHDAAHRKLNDELRLGLDSHHFRLSSLEAVAGRGRTRILRMAFVALIAVGTGYALRAATVSNVTVAGRP